MTVAGHTPSDAPPDHGDAPTREAGLRAGWRRWRRGRPFWGGLLALAAGVEILLLPLAPLDVMIHQGVAGIPSVLMGIVMVVMALAAWFAPVYRTLAGILTTLVAVAALPLSNLGGFLVGTVLGIAGGGMIFAWQPRPAPEAAADPAPPPATTPHPGSTPA